jgi:Tol biopolymer transport system component
MSGSDSQPRIFSAEQLTTALTDVGGSSPPQYLDDIVTQARRTRQRPAWRTPERWLSMTTTSAGAQPLPLIRPRSMAWALLLAVLAVVALAAGTLFIGSTLLRSDAAVVLPPPTGLAGNGLLAYDAGGDIWTMQPDGSDRRQLTSGPEMDTMPVWSPDGTRIAFWTSAIPDRIAMSSEDPDFFAAPFDVVVMDASRGDRRIVASGLDFDRGDQGYGMPPSWAPDGERLTIGYLEGGEPVIDVLSLDAGPAIRVASGHAPSWSPQGDLIAYRSVDPPLGAYVVEPDGSNPRRVSQVSGSGFAFAYPQWSADGQLITFYAGPDGGHDVWVARTDGSEEWPIGDEPVEEYWPGFSPDGRRVAFGRDIGGACCEWQIVVSDPDGSNQVTLDSDPLGALLPPVWSPDGTTLLVRAGGQNASQHPILRLDVTGERPPAELEFDSDTWANFSWQRVAAAEEEVSPSPDPSPPVPTALNGLIAYADQGGDILVMAPDGSDARVLIDGSGSPADEVPAPQGLASPAWSPNGRYLAYEEVTLCCKGGGGIEAILHIVAADGRGDVQVTARPTPLSYLSQTVAWAPDSRRLAYLHDGAIHVFDRTDQTSVDLGVDADSVSWSPDGDWLAYAEPFLDGGSVGVGMIGPDGAGQRVLTLDGLGAQGSWLSWSPDSSALAFACCTEPGDESGSFDIWTVARDGSQVQVTSGPEIETVPVWSPDGTALAVQTGSQDGSEAAIAVMRADGSGPRTLYELPPGDGAGRLARFSWSPDGSNLLATRYRAGSLVVIPLDGSEPTSYPMGIGTASWQSLAR